MSIRRRIRTIITAQCFGAPLPQVLINGGVFSLFILQLGGSKFEVGLVFMLNFVAQTVRVFSARFADVRDTRRMFISWSHVSNLDFLAIFLVEPIRRTYGSRAAVAFACAVFLLQRVTMNVGGTAYQPLIAKIVPTVLRGRFTGAMRRAFQLVSLGVIVLSGVYLGDDPTIGRFYVVLAVLLASSFFRPFVIARIPSVAAEGRNPEKITKNIARPFRDVQFRRFLAFWAYLVFAINIARPFTVPFLKQDLGFPSSITIYSSSLLVLGMAVSLLYWGRLADRLGNRIVFLMNMMLMSFSFLAIACTPRYTVSPAGAVLVGAFSILGLGIAIGGTGIAHTVRTLNAAPKPYRGSYMSAFFIVNGIVAGLTSSLSGLLLDTLPGIIVLGSREILLLRFYFPLGAVLVMSAIPFLRRMRPVSEPPMRESVAIFVESLPSIISVPLQAIRIPYLRNGSSSPDSKHDSGASRSGTRYFHR